MMTKKRFFLVCGGLLLVVGVAGGVWWNWFRMPYALADSPAVDVTVRAEKSRYPDVQETAEDVDTLVRVYVQRLAAGDSAGLVELAAPSYGGDLASAADELVREYGEAAGGHVDVTVVEGSVDSFNPIRVAFDKTGQQQELLLIKDDGHWWLELGEGDPAGAE
jgi:hypothetical protein